MIEAEHTYTLPVTPAQAYACLRNPARDKEWQAACVDAELLDAVPAPGCRYRIFFSLLGRSMHFLCEIVDLQENETCLFRTLEGPFQYEAHYRLRPHAQGTEVHWRFTTEPGRFFGILPASLLRKVLVSQVEKDALTLARLLSATPISLATDWK